MIPSSDHTLNHPSLSPFLLLHQKLKHPHIKHPPLIFIQQIPTIVLQDPEMSLDLSLSLSLSLHIKEKSASLTLKGKEKIFAFLSLVTPFIGLLFRVISILKIEKIYETIYFRLLFHVFVLLFLTISILLFSSSLLTRY